MQIFTPKFLFVHLIFWLYLHILFHNEIRDHDEAELSKSGKTAGACEREDTPVEGEKRTASDFLSALACSYGCTRQEKELMNILKWFQGK